MLEHIPAWLGGLLQNVRAGHDKLVIAQSGLTGLSDRIALSSLAFADGGRLPDRFTADGAGISPPLAWGPLPPTTASLALIVEDPDAPSFQPLVHAIVLPIWPDQIGFAEGALVADHQGQRNDGALGRNSFLAQGWLPPDPPKGHGRHDYVFQLFALRDVPPIDGVPGRAAFVTAITGRVLAAGVLIGTYSRDDPAKPLADGGLGAAAPA